MIMFILLQLPFLAVGLMAPFAHGHLLPEYFEVGVMYPIVTDTHEPHETGQKAIAAIKMAFDHINDKADGVADELLTDVQLRMVARSPLASFAEGAMDAIDMLGARHEDSFMACVGPANIDSIRGAAPVMAEHDVPVVGYSQRASQLGNSVNFPNVLNTIPSYYMDAHAVADIVEELFHWSKVTVMYSDDNRLYGSSSAFLFTGRAKLAGIEILSSHSVISGEEEQALRSAKAFGARIFVFVLPRRGRRPAAATGARDGRIRQASSDDRRRPYVTCRELGPAGSE